MAIWREGASSVTKPAKSKKIVVVREVGGQTIDVTEVATAVAKAVAETMSKELLSKLDNLQIQAVANKVIQYDKDGAIEIDESIIPVAIQTAIEHMNVEGMVKEQEIEDKGLASSKSKLASLLKRTGDK